VDLQVEAVVFHGPRHQIILVEEIQIILAPIIEVLEEAVEAGGRRSRRRMRRRKSTCSTAAGCKCAPSASLSVAASAGRTETTRWQGPHGGASCAASTPPTGG